MATRHNFAVIIKETRKAQGKGWQVVKIIDTKETTCCGYAIPWLKNNSTGYSLIGEFFHSQKIAGEAWYHSDDKYHQIYNYRDEFGLWHNVFFTKYPENYVDCDPECDGRHWNVFCWSHVYKQLRGHFFLTHPSKSYQRKQEQKALMQKQELLIRLDEVQQNLNNVESRKNELLAQLKKFG